MANSLKFKVGAGEANQARIAFFDATIGRPMRRVVSILALMVIALVVVGFLAALLMDNFGITPSSSAIAAFHAIPKPVRIAMEIVIGVPIVVGFVAYFVLEFFELGWFITRPIAWIFRGTARAKQP